MPETRASRERTLILVKGDLVVRESGPGIIRILAKAGTPGQVTGGMQALDIPTAEAEIIFEGDVEITEEGPGSIEILSKAGDESRIRVK